jgi:DNA polymerase-1
MQIVFDIETNSFTERLRRVHCLEVFELDGHEPFSFNDSGAPVTLSGGYDLLQAADLLIGHNVLAFDLRQIAKVAPAFQYDPKKVVDTLVLSKQLFPALDALDALDRSKGWLFQWDADDNVVLDANGNPVPLVSIKGKSLVGSHSLEAWGRPLGIHKGTFGGTTDWTHWSAAMKHYCRLDVRVSTALFRHLLGA